VSGLCVARLGTIDYADALAHQRDLHRRAGEPWLLLLEHPHVYTLGVRARDEHVLVDPAAVGAQLVRARRGGDVTYHGPGQLVGYPVVDVPLRSGAVPAHVAAIEHVLIATLRDVGLAGASRRPGYPHAPLPRRPTVGLRQYGRRRERVLVEPDHATRLR
jgi:lipoic acid synthetase